MKRDMELVREILLKLEDWPMELGDAVNITPDDLAPLLPGRTLVEINYHMDLIHDAGFINTGGSSGPLLGFTYCGLTWTGHEFLDDIRDPDIWGKTKERAKGVAGIGISFIWEIAKAEIRTKLGLP